MTFNSLKIGTKRLPSATFAAGLAILVSLGGCASSPMKSDASPEQASQENSETMCGGEPRVGNGDLEEIRVGHSGGMFTQAYVEWGEQMGCFELFGVEPISVDAGSVEKIAAIVGGSLDVAAESASTTVLAIANSGLELEFISGFHQYSVEDLSRALTPTLDDSGALALESALLIHPDISFTGLNNLEGLKIGVSGMDSIATLGLLRAARVEGLGAQDIQFVSAGSSERSAAFEAGQLDAVILSGPRANRALANGAVLAMYPGAYWYEPGPSTVWITDQAHQRDSGDLIAAFDDGLRATYTLLDEPSHREQFMKFLESEWGFEAEELKTYRIPNLMKGPIELDGLQYLPLKLYEDGLLESGFQLTSQHLFYAG